MATEMIAQAAETVNETPLAYFNRLCQERGALLARAVREGRRAADDPAWQAYGPMIAAAKAALPRASLR